MNRQFYNRSAFITETNLSGSNFILKIRRSQYFIKPKIIIKLALQLNDLLNITSLSHNLFYTTLQNQFYISSPILDFNYSPLLPLYFVIYLIFLFIKEMTTKTKEYIIKVPLTLHDWRRGQRYMIAKYTTDEVSILGSKQRKENGKLITESHKVLNIGKRMPSIISKVLNSKALMVEEFSVNVDEIGETTKVQNDRKKKEAQSSTNKNAVIVTEKKINEAEGLLKEMDVRTVQGVEKKGSHTSYKDEKLRELAVSIRDKQSTESVSTNKPIESISANKSNESLFSTVSSSCETNYVNRYYDTSTFSLSVRTIASHEYKDTIFGQEPGKSQIIDYTDGKEPAIYVYKLVTVMVNSTFLGWICEHIKNTMKNMLLNFQKKMIDSEKEWMNLTEEELQELEKKMISTFMKPE